MAYSLDGVSDYIALPDATGVTDFTVHAIIRPTANTGATKTCFAWDNFPSSPRHVVLLQQNNAGSGNVLAQVMVNDVGDVVNGASPLSTGVDHHISIVKIGTVGQVFLDNVQVGSDITVGNVSFTAMNIRLGCHYSSGSNAEFAPCVISEYSRYSIGLVAADRTSLQAGITALQVQPQYLVRYLPLVNSLAEYRSNSVQTVGGSPTVTTHPRTFRPRSVQMATLAGILVYQGTAALVGDASVTAAARLLQQGGAAFVGVGLLTPAGLVVQQGASGMVAVGVLSPTGNIKYLGQADLSGVGALSASSGAIQQATVSFIGTGKLTPTGADASEIVTLIVVDAGAGAV